jgi:hypothetical protein
LYFATCFIRACAAGRCAVYPDVPVSEFILTMKGGDKGLLENAPPAGTATLCESKNRVDVKFTAQNNKSEHLRPLLKATGCKAKPKHKKHHRGN